ncbi:hypothetical protein Lfu02_28480 [Longispora fulva]|nr:hypothetical protein Lfu02_28480 [Longispora fulva]
MGNVAATSGHADAAGDSRRPGRRLPWGRPDHTYIAQDAASGWDLWRVNED